MEYKDAEVNGDAGYDNNDDYDNTEDHDNTDDYDSTDSNTFDNSSIDESDNVSECDNIDESDNISDCDDIDECDNTAVLTVMLMHKVVCFHFEWGGFSLLFILEQFDIGKVMDGIAWLFAFVRKGGPQNLSCIMLAVFKAGLSVRENGLPRRSGCCVRTPFMGYGKSVR